MNGEVIEDVDRFVYSGANISEEIKRRIQLATGVYGDLKTIWKDNNIKLDIKVPLLRTCVFSVLLYAVETWAINKTDEKRILAFENRCYRWLLRIKWKDHVTNKEVHEQIGRPVSLITIIKYRKLELFGHVTRMHDGQHALLSHVQTASFSRI